MKKIAIAALGLFVAFAAAACGSDTTGGDACYSTCAQTITVGSVDPVGDTCDSAAGQAAAEWYACLCNHVSGFLGFCPECEAACGGAPLDDACKACVTTPASNSCLAPYTACVSP